MPDDLSKAVFWFSLVLGLFIFGVGLLAGMAI